MSDDEILVGRGRAEDTGGFNEALGIALPEADTELLDRILVDDINATGGIGGRRLRVVYYTYQASEVRPQDELAQEACTLWTQDTPVYAVLSGGLPSTDNLRGCLGRAGVPLVFENPYGYADDRTFEEFPTYFETGALELGRQARSLAEGLLEEGFLDPAGDQMAPCPRPVCVGLITFDTEPIRRAVENDLRPALEAAGHDLAGEHYLPEQRSQADLSAAVSQFPALVLEFKSRGINRVLVLADQGGGIPIFLTRIGDSQDYHPRLGLTSASVPQGLIDEDLVAPEAFRGAVAVGWNPFGDLRPGDAEPGLGYDSCIELLEAGGARPKSDINNLLVSLRTCDGFRYLRAAIEAGLPDITAASFVAGAETLAAFPSALTYRVSTGPGRHTGVAAVRHTAYEDACTCFRYRSDLRPL